MLFVGGLLAILLLAIETERGRERPEKVYGLTILLLISAVYGAHIFYWFDFREEYNYGLKHILIFWKGGMALYGGGIFAFLTYVLYTRWQNMDFWATGDLLTPPAALFVLCARIGCILSGCCHGRECPPDFPFALAARSPNNTVPRDTPVYPTQPALAASALIILLVVWARWKRKRFDGEIALIGMLIYSVTSFAIESFRGDLLVLYEVLGTRITQNQVISVNVFVAAVALYAHLVRQKRPGISGRSPSAQPADQEPGRPADSMQP
jgi:phosphatidylglycerol:prolipoprotein diacylglycerol transferase